MNNQAIETTNPDVLSVSVESAAVGEMGEKLLVSGEHIALRLWDEQPEDGASKPSHARDYETVGYVIEGQAELTIADQTIALKPGVSWVVPQGVAHAYRILSPFRAVEATHPPAASVR
jgi:quercetin dioxygenase-like cupin family protein